MITYSGHHLIRVYKIQDLRLRGPEIPYPFCVDRIPYHAKWVRSHGNHAHSFVLTTVKQGRLRTDSI